jgi:hypothetical protein
LLDWGGEKVLKPFSPNENGTLRYLGDHSITETALKDDSGQ